MTAPRRWFSFSLRTLFIVVGVVSVGMAIARTYPALSINVSLAAIGSLSLLAAVFLVDGLL
jgi:hypothetical protein